MFMLIAQLYTAFKCLLFIEFVVVGVEQKTGTHCCNVSISYKNTQTFWTVFNLADELLLTIQQSEEKTKREVGEAKNEVDEGGRKVGVDGKHGHCNATFHNSRKGSFSSKLFYIFFSTVFWEV